MQIKQNEKYVYIVKKKPLEYFENTFLRLQIRITISKITAHFLV